MAKPKRSRHPRSRSQRPDESTKRPARSKQRWRIAVAMLACLVLPMLVYRLWNPGRVESVENRVTSQGTGDAPAAAKEDHPVQPAAVVGERDAEETVTTVAGLVKAPGTSNTTYVAPLADAYRRMDPAADGWETEAFHEATNQQMAKLAHLFESKLDESLLRELADERFAGSSLHPPTLHLAFEDEALRVRRADGLEERRTDALANDPSFAGVNGLRVVIEQFRQLYPAGRVEHVKLKPFRVSVDERNAATTVLFQASGKSATGTMQVNATWHVDWSSAREAMPKLLGIRLEEYEVVDYLGEDDRLFSDCTASVLGEVEAYRTQLLHSTDHWRSRLSRDLGLDVVANHGLALGDVNGDHLDDLYICQQGGLPNRLFIQNPDGTLRDATAESGADWLDYCASALLVDFDNDGDRDLVVAQEWRILIMSNDGQGRFQLEFGISSEAQLFSLAAADYDLDGDLDIYTCGYNPTASTLRRGAMGEPMPYHDANNGGRNTLLRNEGNWLFTDVTSESGLNENNTRFSFAASWEDYDNDGDPDLYVANDYGRNNFYKNEGGQFKDVAAELGIEDMSSGMSCSWGDFNRDGWMDLYVSNMFSAAGNRIAYQRQFKAEADPAIREQFQRHARGNSLFLNTPGLSRSNESPGQATSRPSDITLASDETSQTSSHLRGFRDVSEQANVTMGRWAWGSRFADINGDGWQDLIVANGFITTEDTSDL